MKMMELLSDLRKNGLELVVPAGIEERVCEVNDVVYDSRKAKPGCVFVCLSGAVSDGHR